MIDRVDKPLPKIGEEPGRPMIPEMVMKWFLERRDTDGQTFDAVFERYKDDAPDHVRAYLHAVRDYRTAHEAWKAAQPIDFAHELGMHGAWRMFGGRWLMAYRFTTWTEANIPLPDGVSYERHTFNVLHDAIEKLHEVGPEAFKPWALALYEHITMLEHHEVALAKHVRGLP